MSAKNIAIAYCADNEQTVKQIEQHLNLAGYQFQHYPGTKTTANPPLSDQLLNQPNPILLVISDNFLKAAQCMHRGLKLLQEKRNLILPVVIEGISKDGQAENPIKIQTDFERVSDIIQYINYWQDQYLDLRRQKRQMKDFDEEAFNTHLKIMREISSEAGEFLRVLRGMNYQTHESLEMNHYEQFFKFTGDSIGWNQFKSKAPSLLAVKPAVPPAEEEISAEEPVVSVEEEEVLVEEPTASLEKEEEEVSASPVETQEESIMAEIADIPGIGLIEERQDEYMEEETPTAEIPEEREEEEIPSEEEPVGDEIADVIEWGVGEVEEEEEEEEEVEGEGEVEVKEEGEVEVEVEVKEEEADVLSEEEEVAEADQASVLVEEAMEYFNTGQVQEGLAFMAQAVEENSDSLYLRYHYALMLAQRGQDYSSARKVLQPVVEAEPHYEEAIFLMGELNELLEDFDGARKHYLKLIDINPKYPNAYYRLGMILAAHYEGKQKPASKYLKKAIKLDKKNADACYQYALLLNEGMGKPKKSIELLKRTLKIDPKHPFANYDLALVYYQLGQRKKAKRAYAQAIAINPELHTPENDLAFQEPQQSVAAAISSVEHDAIEALKGNINQLEELLKAREEEAALLLQAMEEAAEKETAKPEPEPPRVDQTVLITGATSGIGRATAEIFARNGYRIIITGRRAKRLEELKGTFEEAYDANVLAIAFDVRDGNAVEEVMDKLGDKGMAVDLLINNAGKAKGLAPIHEGHLDHWEEMIDTNLKGLLYMTRAVAPGMVKRKSGQIINVSSTAGRDVYPNGNVYCATKAAVEALTKSMRLDLHKHNVRVGMVSPAHVEETEFALVRFDGDEDKARIYEGFKPLSSQDVAEAIFFLATRPAHVNVLDIVLQGVQQASSLIIDRSGREQFEEEE